MLATKATRHHQLWYVVEHGRYVRAVPSLSVFEKCDKLVYCKLDYKSFDLIKYKIMIFGSLSRNRLSKNEKIYTETTLINAM